MKKLRELSLDSSSPDTDSTSGRRIRWEYVGLGALLLTITLLVLIAGDDWKPATGVQVTRVVPRAGVVTAGTVSVQASGWLEPDPYAVYVHSLVEGVVDELHVLEGETVEKGQLVATLVREDFEIALDAARAEFAVAEANLASAEATHRRRKEELEETVDRQLAVDTAQAQVDTFAAEIVETQSLVESARSDLAALNAEISRKSPLVESGAVAALEIEQLEGKRAAAAAKQVSLESRLVTLEAKKREANARLVGARRHTELLIEERGEEARTLAARDAAMATRDLLAAQVRRAELDLRRTEVRSPMDGIVLRRLTSPGSNVRFGNETHAGHVVHLYDPSSLQVRTDVPLSDAAKIQPGQRARVVVEVLPNRTFDAQVTRITHEADIQKNTVEVKVAVDNPTGELKPEMLSKVRFVADESNASEEPATSSRWFIDRAAIETANGQSYAYVIDESSPGSGVVRRVALDVPSTSADSKWIEVRSGIREGERVVLRPEGLEDGDRVRWSTKTNGGN